MTIAEKVQQAKLLQLRLKDCAVRRLCLLGETLSAKCFRFGFVSRVAVGLQGDEAVRLPLLNVRAISARTPPPPSIPRPRHPPEPLGTAGPQRRINSAAGLPGALTFMNSSLSKHSVSGPVGRFILRFSITPAAAPQRQDLRGRGSPAHPHRPNSTSGSASTAAAGGSQ